MDMLTEIIKAIAWPIASIWIAYLFRNEVRALLGRMSVFKYKELEAKFERGIETAKVQAQQLEPDKQKAWDNATLQGILTIYELFNRIAVTSPRTAIIEYWLDLEAAIDAAAKKAGIDERSTTKKITSLIEAKHIAPDTLPLFQQLKNLRNQATHLPEFSISVKDAQAYLRSVLQLGNEFRHYAVNNVA